MRLWPAHMTLVVHPDQIESERTPFTSMFHQRPSDPMSFSWNLPTQGHHMQSWWLDVRSCSKANLMTSMLKSKNPMRRCQIGTDDHCQSLTNMNKEIMEKLERNTMDHTTDGCGRWGSKLLSNNGYLMVSLHVCCNCKLHECDSCWDLGWIQRAEGCCPPNGEGWPASEASRGAPLATPWTLLSWDGPDGPDGPHPSRRALRLSSASAMTWKMNRRGAELTCGAASWSTPPHVQNNTRRVTRYGMCRINQYVFSWVYWPPCHRLFFNDSLRLNMWSFQSSACGLVHLKVRYVGQSMPQSRWEGSTCRSRAEAWRGWLEMSAVLVWNQGSAKLGSPDWQWLV